MPRIILSVSLVGSAACALCLPFTSYTVKHCSCATVAAIVTPAVIHSSSHGSLLSTLRQIPTMRVPFCFEERGHQEHGADMQAWHWARDDLPWIIASLP